MKSLLYWLTDTLDDLIEKIWPLQVGPDYNNVLCATAAEVDTETNALPGAFSSPASPAGHYHR